VTVLAAIRPDEWDLALFVHVLGAMVMVGSLAVAAWYLFAARRDGSLEAVRFGFRSLLLAALPSFVVMRVGAQWIADEEGLADSDAAWIGIGYAVSDMGALLVVIATGVAWLALRRSRRAEGAAGDNRGAAVAAWLVAILIAAYVVAIWAMTTKPV
jgi:uncharacterized membrane protein